MLRMLSFVVNIRKHSQTIGNVQGWGQIRICICVFVFEFSVFVFEFVFDFLKRSVFVFVFDVFDQI